MNFFKVLLFLVLTLPSLAFSWDQSLIDAANAVANGNASEPQRVLVYNNNKTINKMALHDRKFEKNIYQKCQNDFFKIHTKNIEEAARKAGLKATLKPPSKIDPKTGDYIFNPGTDSDVDVVPLDSNQKLDLEKIREVENNFQDVLRTQSTNAEVTPPKGKIDTDTDFLPNPNNTTDKDFAEITKHINKNGGTAYTSRESALVQSKLSNNQPIDLEEASKFSQEMDKLAQKKFDHSSKLHKQADAVRQSDPLRAQELDFEADLNDFQGSKYFERQHQLNNKLRQQNGLEPKPRNITGVDEAIDTIKIANRGELTRIEAIKVKGLHENAIQKSTEDLIETLSDIAKVDPSKASKATDAIAKKLSTLPPSKQGSVIAELERTMGSETTKKIVHQTKALNQAKKTSSATSHLDDILNAPTNLNNSMSALKKGFKFVMTVGGVVLTAKAGYDISITNVKPDDTFYDFLVDVGKNSLWYGTGFGTAFEQAEAEELERYYKEFAGEQDPSAVKHITVAMLKTGTYMGRDAIIGLMYLPDAIAQALSWSWGEVTGTNKINAYTDAQNQLANAMKKVILEKQAFNDAINMVKKMGLHDEDAIPFLDCLCRDCGGSLGGQFNPGFEGESGYGPCKCDGSLTIWKTPVPSVKEAQYDCFNKVTKMRHNEAQAIFDAWHQRALEENAKSVEKELHAIIEDYDEALKDEVLARKKSDEIAAIKDLLLERDLNHVRSLYGPCLQNHAHRNVRKGQMDRAIDNLDRAIKKVGIHGAQNEANAKQQKIQFEKWKDSWSEAKQNIFREISKYIAKNNPHKASDLMKELEHKMTPENPLRPLPDAFEDPDYLALEESLNAQKTRCAEWTNKSSILMTENNYEAALKVYEKLSKECNDSYAKERIAFLQAKIKRQSEADELAPSQEELEKAQKKAELLAKIQKMKQENEARKIASSDVNDAKSKKAELAQKIGAIKAAAETKAAQKTQQATQNISAQNNSTKGYWLLTEEKGNVGIKCPASEVFNDYYRDTVSGFGGHVIVTKMVRKGNQAYCKMEAQWQRPPEKLYPGDVITLPVTINRLLDTGKYSCDMSVSFDMHDMKCGFGGAGGDIGSVRSDRKSPKSLSQAISWKVKEPSSNKVEDKLLIRACFSGGTLCGDDRGMKYYYTWVNSDTTSKTTKQMTSEIEQRSADSGAQSIMNLGNIAAVENHPKNPTIFTIDSTCMLITITNYHWNYAKGSTPGTISLRDSGGKLYGPWRCIGKPGQGGVPNAYWIASPDISLPGGSYTIVDSEPETWAHNAGSQYRGMSDIVADCSGSGSDISKRVAAGKKTQAEATQETNQQSDEETQKAILKHKVNAIQKAIQKIEAVAATNDPEKIREVHLELAQKLKEARDISGELRKVGVTEEVRVKAAEIEKKSKKALQKIEETLENINATETAIKNIEKAQQKIEEGLAAIEAAQGKIHQGESFSTQNGYQPIVQNRAKDWSVTFADCELHGWKGESTQLTNPCQGGYKGKGFLKAFAPGDGVTGYYIAPKKMLGDWSSVSQLKLAIYIQKGKYASAYSYGGRGDIYLENGGMSASYEFPRPTPEIWQEFLVPMKSSEWRLGGGAASLGDVLANVTAFHIRAEYILGDEYVGLAFVSLVRANHPEYQKETNHQSDEKAQKAALKQKVSAVQKADAYGIFMNGYLKKMVSK